MKLELVSKTFVGLLTTQLVLAADVMNVKLFEEADCQGDAIMDLYHALTNRCVTESPTQSVKYTCTEAEVFTSTDCTGASQKRTDGFGCVSGSAPGSNSLACKTFPDNKVALVTFGASCDEDGVISGNPVEKIFILDECQRFTGQSLEPSYKLVKDEENDGGLKLLVYNDINDCTGENISIPLEVDTCKDVPGINFKGMATTRPVSEAEIVIRVIPGIEGITLGANASAGSVGIFALIISMIGVLAALG